MWSETRAATSAGWSDGLGDDQVHRDRQLGSVDGCRRQPDSGFGGAGGEQAGAHRDPELRFVAELSGIDRQVSVGGVRRDADLRVAGAEVDRLRPGDDDGPPVCCEGVEGVEEDAPRGHVPRIDRHRHFGSPSRSASEASLHVCSFSRSHWTSASPSAGMRPLPVRQSAAACDGAT